METTTYEKVANVIGSEMDKAWANIMKRLASGDTAGMNLMSNFETSDIKDFFSNLGGANMEINFSSIRPKGQIACFNAYKLERGEGIPVLGIEGTVTVGVAIRF
jgi:hypothetical protein